jgi:hypothetical protein
VLTNYWVDVAGDQLKLTETPDARAVEGEVPEVEVRPALTHWMIAGGLALAGVVVALGLVWARGRKSSD